MPIYRIAFSFRDFIFKMKLYDVLVSWRSIPFLKAVHNWDVTHEANAFERNQIRYMQGSLGSGCSLCLGTVPESVLENTWSPADIIVPIQQIVFCLMFNLYHYKHISLTVHQFSYLKGTGSSFPGIKRPRRQTSTHFPMKSKWSCTCIPALYLNHTWSNYRLMRWSFPELMNVALKTDTTIVRENEKITCYPWPTEGRTLVYIMETNSLIHNTY